MGDPQRLFDGAGNDDERRLIGFARTDAPPHDSLARTLSALGVAGGVLAPTLSHAATLGAKAAIGTAGGASAITGTGITLAAVTKWLAIGIAGGTLTMATANLVNDGGAPRAPEPTHAPQPARGKEAPAIAPALEPKLPAPVSPEGEAKQEKVPQTETGDRLRDELALLEQARRSLAQGRSEDAREALRRHREAFPTGALTEEADVLRIEVLILRGELGLAEQAGRDFLDAHPRSPHTPHVRELLVRAASDPKSGARPLH